MAISVNTSEFTLDGTAIIFAEESPGGAVFSTQVSNTAAPVPPSERIELLSIDRAGDGRITLTWTANPGTLYEIQRSTSLSANSWSTFRNKTPGSSIGSDDFLPTGNPSAEYYRVIIP